MRRMRLAAMRAGAAAGAPAARRARHLAARGARIARVGARLHGAAQPAAPMVLLRSAAGSVSIALSQAFALHLRQVTLVQRLFQQVLARAGGERGERGERGARGEIARALALGRAKAREIGWRSVAREVAAARAQVIDAAVDRRLKARLSAPAGMHLPATRFVVATLAREIVYRAARSIPAESGPARAGDTPGGLRLVMRSTARSEVPTSTAAARRDHARPASAAAQANHDGRERRAPARLVPASHMPAMRIADPSRAAEPSPRTADTAPSLRMIGQARGSNDKQRAGASIHVSSPLPATVMTLRAPARSIDREAPIDRARQTDILAALTQRIAPAPALAPVRAARLPGTAASRATRQVAMHRLVQLAVVSSASERAAGFAPHPDRVFMAARLSLLAHGGPASAAPTAAASIATPEPSTLPASTRLARHVESRSGTAARRPTSSAHTAPAPRRVRILTREGKALPPAAALARAAASLAVTSPAPVSRAIASPSASTRIIASPPAGPRAASIAAAPVLASAAPLAPRLAAAEPALYRYGDNQARSRAIAHAYRRAPGRSAAEVEREIRHIERTVQTQVVREILHRREHLEQIRATVADTLRSPALMRSLVRGVEAALAGRASAERYRLGAR